MRILESGKNQRVTSIEMFKMLIPITLCIIGGAEIYLSFSCRKGGNSVGYNLYCMPLFFFESKNWKYMNILPDSCVSDTREFNVSIFTSSNIRKVWDTIVQMRIKIYMENFCLPPPFHWLLKTMIFVDPLESSREFRNSSGER